MNVFSNLIYGYNITIIKLLIPILGISLMSIFIMLYLLLSIRTKKLVYISISIILTSVLIYNIISLIIIFLGTYGIYKNIALNLFIAENILMLIFMTLAPVRYNTSQHKNKTLDNISKIIFMIIIIMSTTLILLSFMNFNIFFRVSEYHYSSANESYYFIPTGLFFKYKTYIILFVFILRFISTISDMVINYNYKYNIPIIIANIIALILLSTDIYFRETLNWFDFDEVGFAIILVSSVRCIVVFASFSKNALESIKRETLLNNKLHNNLKTLTNINKISEELSILDKNLMDTSMFIFEIDKESKDAYSIIDSKISSILNANNELINTKNSKKGIVKDGIKYTNAIFNFFDKYKNQMQDHFRTLNQIISNMKDKEFDSSNSQLISLNNDLKNVKKELKESSDRFLNNIIESVNQFKDVNTMTESIFEIISYIKSITDKTNLLSINAGIQASKAGFLGKSFSVVAKEIGTLSFEISKGTESIEKMLTNISSGLVVIENSSFYIKDRCKIMQKEINKIIEYIDSYIVDIENNINSESKKLTHFKLIEEYNESISNILSNQNLIVLSIKENILAIFDVQNNINSKIEYQNQDINKIFNNFDNIIKSKDQLNEIAKKIGSYSSFSHTDIETLSNIINSHKKKSSFTFAPIITLLKKSS